MFWCHNCQKPIQSVERSKCEFCSCEAIEQISHENNPQNFEPYVPQQGNQNNQQQQREHSQLTRDPSRQQFPIIMSPGIEGMSMMSTLFSTMGGNNSPLLIRYTFGRPVFGLILIDNEEHGKTSVDEEKLNKLQKVNMQEECAICQQKDGAGLRLPCKHQFHEHCIRPWFQQTNTCPCCRVAL